jgi:hypothetical protein
MRVRTTTSFGSDWCRGAGAVKAAPTPQHEHCDTARPEGALALTAPPRAAARYDYRMRWCQYCTLDCVRYASRQGK